MFLCRGAGWQPDSCLNVHRVIFRKKQCIDGWIPNVQTGLWSFWTLNINPSYMCCDIDCMNEEIIQYRQAALRLSRTGGVRDSIFDGSRVELHRTDWARQDVRHRNGTIKTDKKVLTMLSTYRSPDVKEKLPNQQSLSKSTKSGDGVWSHAKDRS